MPPYTTFSVAEWNLILATAWHRIIESSAKGLNPATTYRRSMLERIGEELVGAAAEFAVAKWVGKFWTPGLNVFHFEADCGKDIEVRGTGRVDGSLIIRDNDESDRRYVLVILHNDRASLVGWCFGHEAKKPDHLKNPHGRRQAWFVPQDALRSIETLQIEEEKL
jgi:hypothetical protein